MDERWHGTPGGYNNHKCRCDECRAAWNKYCRDRKRARRSEYEFRPGAVHGVESEYQRGCTCTDCTTAHARNRNLLKTEGKSHTRGTCEICRTSGRVVWDHDHKTGSHRGWLCINCNQALGLFLDRKELLERAVKWVS